MFPLLFVILTFTKAFAMTGATPQICESRLLAHPDPRVAEWIHRVKNLGATDAALPVYGQRFDHSLKDILARPAAQRTFANTILAADSARFQAAFKSRVQKPLGRILRERGAVVRAHFAIRIGRKTEWAHLV